MTTRSINKALLVGGLALGGAALQLAVPSPAAAATGSVSGTVVCASGAPVVGLWVNSSAGGSGWAGWTRMPGAAHVAQYSRSINVGGTVSLNVGCGGTPSAWGGNNATPGIGVAGSRTLNSVCSDASGSGVRCSFPRLGATRSTNWFSTGYCTWGAAQKLREAIGSFPAWSGDAKYWASNAAGASWTVRPEPMARSIFVFQPGQGTNSSSGHVGWVDAVEYRSDGAYIRTTEMNARGWNVWSNEVRKVPASARFILVP